MCDDESIVEIVNYATLIRTKILFQSTVGVACLKAQKVCYKGMKSTEQVLVHYNLKKT